VDVIYRREDTVIGRLGPSEQISVRLTLATLGSR
jgi:LPS-assembly protein